MRFNQICASWQIRGVKEEANRANDFPLGFRWDSIDP
jgi:hypothetical protein